MGCISSTEVSTDPMTGQTKNKHKMGGSYPGNRRTPQQQYTPSPSQFQNGQATAHFVSYGGGNALVLQQANGIAQPQTGQPLTGKQPTYIQVTLPDNVYGGDRIHVQAPDGRLNEIIVPSGFGPGSTFTVEFADNPPPKKDDTAPYMAYAYAAPASHATTPTTTAPAYAPSSYSNNNNNNSNNYATSSAAPTRPTDYDDGFASGFNNPNFVPTVSVQAHGGRDEDIDLSAYPSASYAKPVY